MYNKVYLLEYIIMSKGSKRRPGSNYPDNYDKVFPKKPEPKKK